MFGPAEEPGPFRFHFEGFRRGISCSGGPTPHFSNGRESMRNAKQKALILAAATTAAATVLINTRSLSAASVTWNGGGIDNNWSTALN